MVRSERPPTDVAPVRIALAGCGRVAQLVHLDALARLPEVELVAVADTDPDLRRRAAARVAGTAAVERVEELCGDAGVEAILIALPTHLHAEAARAALAAGKHVYIEKPLATSVEEARSVLHAWRGSGLTATVGFNLRFQPHYRQLRDDVADERIGAPVAVRSIMGSARRELPAWKRSRATGGGVLLDLGSHQVDLIRFVLGREIVRALGSSHASRGGAETISLVLELDDGTPVQLLASHAGIDVDRFEVMGDRGALVVDRLSGGAVEFVDVRHGFARRDRLRRVARAARHSYAGARRELMQPGEPSFAAALLAFAAAVRGAASDAADLEAGLRNLEVLHAVEQAAETGAAVAVAERAAA